MAGVTLTFYSHELGASFPHAFVALEGTTEDGVPVVDNFGFTAKHLSPAILLGSVAGGIESAGRDYVEHSQAHWQMDLDEQQYISVRATIDKWRTLPGKSYNLKRRNCVSFVADIARVVGMKTVEPGGLIMKPRSFLDALYRQNETLKILSANARVPMLDARPPSG